MKIASKQLRVIMNRGASVVGCGEIAFPPIPRDGEVRFYKRDRPSFGFLSNFHPAPVTIDDRLWPHTEAFYQSRKANNPDYHTRLLQNHKPSWSKYVGDSRIGHPKIAKQSWFRKRPQDLRDDWDSIKLDVMRVALDAKFRQHSSLRRSLLETLPADIVEDSASDFFWGVGSDGSGENWLGRLLMEVRASL
ncbi:MAG: NADAR family protein [Planctomycetota bacterium]